MSNPQFDIALSFLFRNRLRKSLALVDHYGSAQEAWHHLNEPQMKECWARAGQELEWIHAHGIRVWTLADDDYPYRLRQCPDKPLVLYGKGNIEPSAGHFVSIVGTRRPTEHGKEITRKLVRELHERLEQLTIYPYQHRAEAVSSLMNGGLLTEFPSGTEPLPKNFLQRNRIIAGLSDATVVVESKERGGSLVTANMAVDYARELFTFPGRPEDASSQGCNNLIRSDKAHLITCADDLITFMGWKTKNTTAQPVQTALVGLLADLSPTQQTLLDKLQEAEEGLNINFLVMETDLPYETVASEMLMLELQGLVRSLPGGIYRFQR